MTPSAALSLALLAALWTPAPGPSRSAASPPAAATPHALEGETPDAVRQLLGEPDVAHGEGGGHQRAARENGCLGHGRAYARPVDPVTNPRSRFRDQSPRVSSRPSIRLRFWTAAPEAPLPRLSSTATSLACPAVSEPNT